MPGGASIALLGVPRAIPVPNTRSNKTVEVQKRSWPSEDAVDELQPLFDFLTFSRVTAVNKVTGLDRSKQSKHPGRRLAKVSILGVIQHLTAVER